MRQQNTRIDRFISRVRDNPIVVSVVALGGIVIALSTFTDATKTLLALVTKPQPEVARAQLSQLSYEYTPTAFVESAKKGDAVAVKLFLAVGIDPNAIDDKGNTAMMYAAGEGDAEIINVLLKAKAEVNKKNAGGATALLWAASAGNKTALRLLLNNGADGEAINEAFVGAAEHGQLEVLHMLLDNGVDVSKVGSKALGHTAGSDDIETSDEALSDVVRLLLDHGVKANVHSNSGWTALHLAVDRGHRSIVRILLDRGADANATCDCPQNIASSQNINASGVEYIDDDVDVLGPTTGGKTALMLATSADDMEIVQALLNEGADVNAKDDDGTTVLMKAGHDADVVRVLVDKGADVNAKRKDGLTALIRMAYAGYVDNVRVLLDRRAEVNAKSVNGKTALMWAAGNGHVDVARVLLERGARANEKDVNGNSALGFAKDRLGGGSWAEIVQLLTTAGAK